MKVILASQNQHKLVELSAILSQLGFEIALESEYGLKVEVEETGTTFEENAAIKAKAVCDVAHTLCLSDDSGLVIDYLNGEPGIYSARYLGHDTPYEEKNRIIVDRLKGVPEEKRTARFVCAVAAAFPDGRVITVKDTMEGRIAEEPAGCGGFGYDPIFFFPPKGMTSAELTPDEKNAVSHRGKALRKMVSILEKEL